MSSNSEHFWKHDIKEEAPDEPGSPELENLGDGILKVLTASKDAIAYTTTNADEITLDPCQQIHTIWDGTMPLVGPLGPETGIELRLIAEGSSMAGPTAGWTEDRRPRKNIAGHCRPWTMFKLSHLRLL